jgi:CBS domain-containing membrane protein
MSLLAKLFPHQASITRREMLISAVAAGVAIALNAWVSHVLLPGDYQVFLAASMGASTILVIAVHHSPLSQPWAIVGGHLAGALSGLLVAAWVRDPVLACMLAMALTVLVQMSLRCLHAPGGGTALLPILGAAALRAEGFGFVGVVLLNALVLVAVALVVNNLLPGRRYPLAFAPRPPTPVQPVFREEDLLAALRSMQGYIDVSPDDLERIYEHARAHLREHWDGAPRR